MENYKGPEKNFDPDLEPGRNPGPGEEIDDPLDVPHANHFFEDPVLNQKIISLLKEGKENVSITQNLLEEFRTKNGFNEIKTSKVLDINAYVSYMLKEIDLYKKAKLTDKVKEKMDNLYIEAKVHNYYDLDDLKI